MTDELRKLAMAVLSANKALQGHVCMYEDDRLPCPSTLHDDMIGAYEAFGNAISPATVLALLDRIAELEASNHVCAEQLAECWTKAGALQAEVDNLTQYAEAIERKLRFAGQERDESREAVKRLAGALDKIECDSASIYARNTARDALADPTVRGIVEECPSCGQHEGNHTMECEAQ